MFINVWICYIFSIKKIIGEEKKSAVDFLNPIGWRQFSSGFILGGFGGSGIAYILLKLVNIEFFSF